MATAGSPPPGLVDADKGPTILVTSIVVTVLSTLFVGARLFTRLYLLGKMHLDDYFMIAAMVCSFFFLHRIIPDESLVSYRVLERRQKSNLTRPFFCSPTALQLGDGSHHIEGSRER